ncbi:MAG: hypothetical protein RLZZ214_959 [Verrucomicrobiota bacterium]|jgi:hypothetical protein
MDHSTNSNVIIGSKLALAMSTVIGSPVRPRFATPSDRKRVEFAKMDRRCEALKIRSLKLLAGMKAEDIHIASEAACMRSSADREATKRIGRMLARMVDQQSAFHSKMEKLLDAMLLQIRSDKDSNS